MKLLDRSARPGSPEALEARSGRGTRAIIDLGSLGHNLRVLRQRLGGSRLMAVVKANAYGHGIEPVVGALGGVDAFAVATIGEAARVRAVAPDHPILLLEGVLGEFELKAAADHNLWLTVHSAWQIDLLERFRCSRPLSIWLKVDTGMNRLGFRADDLAAALARLRTCDQVAAGIVLMSHLANADDTQDPKTVEQLARLQTLSATTGLATCSLANSAGLLGWPESRQHWARVGLGLYGGSPLLGRAASDFELRPCMTLESTLIAINTCRAGDEIGYGGAWCCPEDMPVGIVGIGYGDGYPRHAPSGTPVLVCGQQCPIVGRVSMDMLAVDLRKVPGAAVGDIVQLWGEDLPVETVAEAAETISYELLCGVTARVPAVYRGADGS